MPTHRNFHRVSVDLLVCYGGTEDEIKDFINDVIEANAGDDMLVRQVNIIEGVDMIEQIEVHDEAGADWLRDVFGEAPCPSENTTYPSK